MLESQINLRIPTKLKTELDEVSEQIGITPATALRIMIKKYVECSGFPFPVVAPTKETLAAMNEIKTGKLKTYSSFEEMVAKIDKN